ncbi:hypothetical protein V2J09_009857 [Rumex salicifolius]
MVINDKFDLNLTLPSSSSEQPRIIPPSLHFQSIKVALRSSRCSGLRDSTGAPQSPSPCRTARTPEDDADGAHLKSLEDEPLLEPFGSPGAPATSPPPPQAAHLSHPTPSQPASRVKARALQCTEEREMTKLARLSQILRNCVSSKSMSIVKQIHAFVLTDGHIPDVTISTDLLLAYTRCAHLKHACNVFVKMPNKNMHSWNILICSYVQHCLFSDAMSVFVEFLKSGLRPDHYTLPAALKACARTQCFDLGINLHSWILRNGFESYVFVGSSLLDLYIKSGDVTSARKVFMSISFRDLVLWNMMISGFARASCFAEALDCFRSMIREMEEFNKMTIPSVLDACGGAGDLMKGKEVHGKLVKCSSFDVDVTIENALIDMYSKTGCLLASENVFKVMRERNLVTWTSMISCYGHHGKGKEALALFEKMQEHGHQPNSVTLTAVLYSCNHSGLVNKGQTIFHSMKQNYGFEPSMEHCACMVDLLGRCGRIKEAFELIGNMKKAPTASIWGALLSSCVMHKCVQIGEIAASHLFALEPRNCSNYIALCSIYDSLGLSDSVLRIRSNMRNLGLLKTPACSWITVDGRIHRFYKGDLSHPLAKLISQTLDSLIESMTLNNHFKEKPF